MSRRKQQHSKNIAVLRLLKPLKKPRKAQRPLALVTRGGAKTLSSNEATWRQTASPYNGCMKPRQTAHTYPFRPSISSRAFAQVRHIRAVPHSNWQKEKWKTFRLDYHHLIVSFTLTLNAGPRQEQNEINTREGMSDAKLPSGCQETHFVLPCPASLNLSH